MQCSTGVFFRFQLRIQSRKVERHKSRKNTDKQMTRQIKIEVFENEIMQIKA